MSSPCCASSKKTCSSNNSAAAASAAAAAAAAEEETLGTGCCNKSCHGADDGGGSTEKVTSTKDSHSAHHHGHSSHHSCSHSHHHHHHSHSDDHDDEEEEEEQGHDDHHSHGHHHHHHRSENVNEEDDDAEDADPICLAVVREDGTDIVLFDAQGIPRTFWYPTTTTTTTNNDNSNNNNNNKNVVMEKVPGDIRRLCFSTHGLVGKDNDDFMTHCLDDNGHHGTPDEFCMCGVDTPHLHAHLHHPATCGNDCSVEECRSSTSDLFHGPPAAAAAAAAEKSTIKTTTKKPNKIDVAGMSLEERFHFLATHILHPKDDEENHDKKTTTAAAAASSRPSLLDIAVSERMPKECNSHHFSSRLDKINYHSNKNKKNIAKFKVRHDDHDDFLVHDKSNASLHLQHEGCDDCGGGVDVHGRFRALARRRWKRSNADNNNNKNNNNRHIQIHFFDIAPNRPFRFFDHLDNLFSLDSDRVRAATQTTAATAAGTRTPPVPTNKNKQVSSSFPLPSTAAAAAAAAAVTTSKCCAHHHDHQHDDDATEATAEAEAPAAGGVAAGVRSTFRCTRICCSSEIPVIKKALSPIPGIENILVNVPLKQVLVDHCPSLCTAQQVVQALNGYHLGAAVQRDGAGAAAAQAAASSSSSTIIASTVGRSQFYVANICCASEIPMINGIVKPLFTVSKVSINVTTKMVYVDHNYIELAASDILMALNNESFGAELRVDAAHVAAARHAPGASRSLFVTSQFTFTTDERNEASGSTTGGVAASAAAAAAGVSVDELKTFLQSYDATQVECFVVDEPTKTITVIHNPHTLTAMDICQGLATKTSIHAQVLTDGGTRGGTGSGGGGANQGGFDYDAAARLLQDQDDGDDAARNAAAAATADFKRSTWPKPTVILSGVFWLISMLALIGGNFEYLKYVGLVSVAFGLPPIALKAFRTMRRIQFDTNCLMFFASIGALALGEFEEAAAVVFLFALSEWLEVRATTRARQALSAIVNLRPDKANLVHPATQELIVVPASVVPVGALVSVRTGDKIPCDGVVVEGESTVDESSLTGESRPIRKGPQDKVSGGTVNSGETQLLVRTISTAENSAVSRLIRLVEEAQANRSETEQLVDEFAKFYTPLVVLAALLMCSIPWAFGKELGRQWTNNGLVLIVVACPCALIISTPVSYVAGLAATAQKGILIKGG
jgi:cation transport ATPase